MATRHQSPDSLTVAAVRDRLDRVTDPELDESIVALEYVDEISIDGSHVSVVFTLPTAWCSPAFAWMMATDARDEVEALPGVERATVTLREHMHEDEITEGVTERKRFGEVFPDADGGVASIRATLDAKARLARQYDAVEALLEAGLTGEQVAALTREDCRLEDGAVFVRDGSVGIPIDPAPVEAYLEKARVTGLLDDGQDALFRTPEGEPIPAESFELVHRRARLASVNMSGQGSVCDALNRARHAPGRPPLS
ncbi:iron-sulfur cluster assembly protein [Natronomonas sp. EA1]|uniref:iron-sulfur cluster assembly protein n=1 Tax=Natronomonas sp. EA1 TaxID=3421655 RepID=UPI003EC05FDC